MFIFSTNTFKNKQAYCYKKSPILYHFLVAKWQLQSSRVILIPQIRISAKISTLALYQYWGRAPALYRDYIARPKRARRAPANLKRIITHWGHWWRRLQPTSSIIADAKSVDSNLVDFDRKTCIDQPGTLHNNSSKHSVSSTEKASVNVV